MSCKTKEVKKSKIWFWPQQNFVQNLFPLFLSLSRSSLKNWKGTAGTMEDTTTSPSCYQKVDSFAKWFGMGVTAVFFASLQRFSCVNVDADGEDDDDEEAHDRPLMLTTFPSFVSSASTSSSAHNIRVWSSSLRFVSVEESFSVVFCVRVWICTKILSWPLVDFEH